MRKSCLGLLLCAYALCPQFLSSAQSSTQPFDVPFFLEESRIPRAFEPAVFPVRPAKQAGVRDWSAAIDSLWGPGESTEVKLAAFDNFWDLIDQRFAAFQGIDVDWDALRARYRTEVATGTSLGRFAAIMNHMARELRESHTRASTPLVNFQTMLAPGIPLMFVGGWGDHRHFGACLTPLPDSTLLVYKANADHPLQLAPGDRVLGYEGERWTRLYRELLEAELPMTGTWWGSSPSSYDHSFLAAAGMNWHLFDSIDVMKFGSNDTLRIETAALVDTPNTAITCNEQMPIPTIKHPEVFQDQVVTWGILPGTRVGYIYVYGWFSDAEDKFNEAILSLATEDQAEALIIDFRLNYGGNMFLSNKALQFLFNERVTTIGFAERDNSSNRLGMKLSSTGPPLVYVINGDPSTFFEGPIAVLMGPGALSSGDQVALRMTFHPGVRTFGKSTATAFNAPRGETYGQDLNELSVRYAHSDAYLVPDETNYLTHDEFFPDVPVWLEPADVAEGIDTVVEAALDWIESTIVTSSEPENPVDQFTLDQNYPNPFSSRSTISFSLPEPGFTRLVIYDLLGRQVASVVDEHLGVGRHEIGFQRESLPSGVYRYELSSGHSRQSKTMVVIR